MSGKQGGLLGGFLLELVGKEFGSRGDSNIQALLAREENNGRKYLFPLEASISLQPWKARGPLKREAATVSESQTENIKVHVGDRGVTQISKGITRNVIMKTVRRERE